MLTDAARILASVSVLFGVVDYVSAWLMLAWPFALGIPVARRRITVNDGIVWRRDVFDTESAKVRSIGHGHWIFRFRPSGLLYWETPFPIRGTLRLSQGSAELVGRQPVWAFLFLLAFVVLTGPIVGLVLAVAFYGISYLGEAARFETIADQVCAAVGLDPNARAA